MRRGRGFFHDYDRNGSGAFLFGRSFPQAIVQKLNAAAQEQEVAPRLRGGRLLVFPAARCSPPSAP